MSQPFTLSEGSIKAYLDYPEKREELYNTDPDVCSVASSKKSKSDLTESKYRQIIDEVLLCWGRIHCSIKIVYRV